MSKEEKKLHYIIGADLYNDKNEIKKVEINIDAETEEEAFSKFVEEVKKIHKGKFQYNGILKKHVR
mgnify:FL=1